MQDPASLSEDSVACLERVLSMLSKQPGSHLNKLIEWSSLLLFSRFYFKQGDLGKTIEFAEKVRSLGLNYSPENTILAAAYSKKGDYKEAKEFATRALEINPEHEARSFLESIIAAGSQ